MMRVKTGIEELDKMLGGGFMRGDAVMIAGSAGTGKTTLALQYLVNGITKYGENGIYISFEQMPDQIYRDANNLGWDLRKFEREDKLRLVCTSPNLMIEENAPDSLLNDIVEQIKPRRIVIDSLSHLAMYLDEKQLRKEAYRIIMWLKTKGLSSLLLWETPQIIGHDFSITEVGLSFLVDSIVLLKHVEAESSIKHSLVILKLRGSDHDRSLRQYRITSNGISIMSPLLGYEGILTGTAKRMNEMASRFSDWLQNQTVQISYELANKVCEKISSLDGVRYCAVRDVLGNTIAGGQKEGVKEMETEVERLDSNYRVSLMAGSIAAMPVSFGRAEILSIDFERLHLYIVPIKGAILYVTVELEKQEVKEKILRILKEFNL